MLIAVGLIDGLLTAKTVTDEDLAVLATAPSAFYVLVEPYSVFNDTVEVELSLTQKDAAGISPETTAISFILRDSYNNDVILNISGSLDPDEENYQSIMSVADATEEFKQFDLTIGGFFAEMVADSDMFNPIGSMIRKKATIAWPVVTPTALSSTALFDAITEFDDQPNYLCMFYDNNLAQFQTLLSVSEKLNVPFKVELDPTMTVDQVCQIATDLSAFSHRVEIIWNPVLARPNSAETLKGRKKPRYALGSIMGYTLLRNSNTNAQGIPPLQNPIAGHNFPMRWPSMEMRSDIKLNEAALNKLAKAKVNVVLREKFDTGTRFIVNDCLTQYDSKTSVLRLTSSAEISMYVDNRLITISRRHLLKAKATFKSDALRECKSFLESCVSAGLLVNSSDLGGAYTLDITDRVDRPHDAVDLKCGYRPEGAVRAVYLQTSVHK